MTLCWCMLKKMNGLLNRTGAVGARRYLGFRSFFLSMWMYYTTRLLGGDQDKKLVGRFDRSAWLCVDVVNFLWQLDIHWRLFACEKPTSTIHAECEALETGLQY